MVKSPTNFQPTPRRDWSWIPPLLAFLLLSSGFRTAAASIDLHLRSRTKAATGTNDFRVVEKTVAWDLSRTAVVVCDMWDQHHCPDATARVGEMAPRMNEVLKSARAQGALIFHCPSDTLKFYENHPGRALAQSAPKVTTTVPLTGWCSLDGVKEAPLPIDDSDGGCDGCPECPGYRAWSRQHPALEIQDGDAITDSAEAFYLMRQRGITNVIVMGVHINMCVLGRPFAIRQMVAQGQNVALMRDLTDSMYNHRKAPYVSHFRGTEMVVEHIEKYWCPSVTSADFLGGQPFRFRDDIKKSVVMVIGENEYNTWETLPEFARQELEWRGYQVSYVLAPNKEGDPNFQNYETIRNADLVLISVRRRTPPKEMMNLLRAHVEAGKAVVGIRTASHAFDAKPVSELHASWSSFDLDIFGGKYTGHYNNKPPRDPDSHIRPVDNQANHFVLTGIRREEFLSTSHLYKYDPLSPTTTLLVQGKIPERNVTEPVAWVNTAADRRAFYTSLGNPDDFQIPAFRRLLLNGILWCLHDPVPPADAALAPAAKPSATKATAPVPAPVPTPAAPKPPTAPVPDLPQEANAPALSPASSLAHFQVAEDLEWQQVLAEPEIAQPVFLNFDERGRLWLVEFRQYPSPAGLKRLSHDNVWRSVYDRVPPPPPNHFRGADRITIHEDSNGDGEYDRHRIFVDGLNIVTSVERGRNGVWVLNPPYLLFYPDANGDDVPDSDPEVRLSGFGLEDTHSVANSLRWGPDGWLYGAQGSTVTGNILVYDTSGKPISAQPIYSQGQNIWRYQPEKRIYEVFSEGGGNAFGCEIDSQGRIFSGHNGGNTRGFHYVQGAYLQKGFEKHGPLSNPYAFGYFPAMSHGDVPRFTHNFIIYDHGALPERYHGHLFGVEPLQGRIVESEIVPEGSTFKTRDLSRPVSSTDRWFRPVDIKVGPDGAIYVCDWYDQQVNHFRNHEGKMDASNGRVYRLKRKGAAPQRAEDLSKLGGSQLIDRLAHPNRWVRQTVLRLLADRRESSTTAELRRRLSTATGPTALEYLWALSQCGGVSESEIGASLRHPDALVRQWAIRLAGDDQEMSSSLATQMSALAATDPSLEVQVQLAATAKRLPADQGLAIVEALALRSPPITDSRVALLTWWALEVQCKDHSEAVLRLFRNPRFWDAPENLRIPERSCQRWAQAGTTKDLELCARLFDLSPSSEHSRRLIAGFEAAYQGRSLAGLPPRLVKAMSRHGVASPAFAVRSGDPAAIRRALRVIGDETAPRGERLAYLNVLAEVKMPGALPVLSKSYRGVYRDDGLRKALLSALQLYDEPEVGQVVLSTYPALGSEARATAQTLLSSRSVWGTQFARAIAKKDGFWSESPYKAETVPLNIVRKLQQHRDPELRALVDQVWPNAGTATSAEMEAKIQRLSRTIREGDGDPYAGRTLFQNSCAGCHQLFGKGAEVGPNLTTYNRTDIESMLLAVVNPNAEIREGFENYSVETKDGRSLSGFLVENNDQFVVLRSLDNQNQSLGRADLESITPVSASLMPEGLLDGWKDQDICDLFGYLRSTQPLVGEPPKKPVKAARP